MSKRPDKRTRQLLKWCKDNNHKLVNGVPVQINPNSCEGVRSLTHCSSDINFLSITRSLTTYYGAEKNKNRSHKLDRRVKR